MNLRSSLLRGFAPAVSALALVAMVSTAAHAATATVADGSFSNDTVDTQVKGFSGSPSYGTAFAASGWTNNGAYAFIDNSSNAKINDNYGDTVQLVGSPTASPNGGNFLALDADSGYNGTGVSSSISNLTAGLTYAITFDFAASEQTNQSGVWATTTVDSSVNGGSVSAFTLTNPGSTAITTGWSTETFDFLATAATESISFTASSTPNANVPAFALLDGVSVAQVTPPATPEPNSLILLGTGLAGLGGLFRSRFVKATTKA